MDSPTTSEPNVARLVVDAFGGLTKLGHALGGCAPSTIHFWVKTGKIPAWRKRDIVEAAKRAKVELPSVYADPLRSVSEAA